MLKLIAEIGNQKETLEYNEELFEKEMWDVITSDVQDLLEMMRVKAKVDKFKESNPNATNEEILKFLD